MSAHIDWYAGLRHRWASLVAAMVVVVGTTLLFLPSWDEFGLEMDEGLLVAYPSLIQEGLVPGRDFTTFYGPGVPYLVAGAFELFEPTLTVERAVGFLFRLVIALSIMVLVLPLGPAVAALAALAAMLVVVLLHLQALAIFGGIAALLSGLTILSRTHSADLLQVSSGHKAFVAAGVLGGIALCFRPDLAPAVLLGAAPLLAFRKAGPIRRRPWIGYVLGVAIGSLPLLVWAAVVGPDQISRLVEDLAASRSGRRLPLPELGSAQGQLLLATMAVASLALVGGILRLRTEGDDWLGRVLLAIGITLVCLLPTALQRADAEHILPPAGVAVGLFPLVAAGCLGRARARGRRRLVMAGVVGAAAVGVAIAVVHQARPSLELQIRSIERAATPVRVGDRYFRVADPEAAASLNRLLPILSRHSRPGERLFVGTQDLRRTVYADTFVYFLLPELRPASFYTELNPGTANDEDSSLVEDLREADALLLTTRFDWLAEQTDAAGELGPAAPNQVVDEEFCVDARHDTYTLYRRC